MSKRYGNRSLNGCTKRRFRDELAAKMALADIHRNKRGPERREKYEQRCYPCPNCRGWHLTSQA